MTRDQVQDYGRLRAAIAALRAVREPLRDVANSVAILERVRDRHGETYATTREEGRDG